MARNKSWYQRGFDDALAGLPSDAPWQPGNRHHENYRAGFRDGQQQAEANQFADPNWVGSYHHY